MVRTSPAALLVVAAVGAAGLAGFSQPEARSAPSGIVTQAKSPSSLLGVVSQQQSPLRLVRIDPQSLRPLPGRGVDLGSAACAPRSGGQACWNVPAWSFSPARSLVAFARNLGDEVRSLRLVDGESMRVTGDIRLRGGPVGALAWLAPGRVLALQEECCSERQLLLAVDLAKRRVAARTRLRGSVVRVGRTSQDLVLLLAPAQRIGPARLAVADRRGSVRFVGLERILAGTKVLNASDHRVDHRTPGLAVDPKGRRAFVVDDDVAAEVDLARLAVSYHRLVRPVSLFARLRNWLEPKAHAKSVSGWSRKAVWLGNGLIAVSGSDYARVRSTPAGLLLVDSRSWTVRVADPEASHFVVAEDLLLATGGTENHGTGLGAFGFDGEKRFQLFEGEQVWVDRIYDGFAHIGTSGANSRQDVLRVVDLAAGRVVGERSLPVPWLVVDVSSGWWDG